MHERSCSDLVGNAGRNVAEYPLVDCFHYLSANPNVLITKGGSELLAAAIVAMNIDGVSASDCTILYILRDKERQIESRPAPTLAEIVNNPVLLEDEDIDLGIREQTLGTYLLQVARVMPADLGRGARDLFSVLDSKLVHKPHKDKVQLVVFTLDQLKITDSQIADYFRDKVVPYPGIFVVGSVSEDNTVFSSAQIYPEFITSAPVSIHLFSS